MSLQATIDAKAAAIRVRLAAAVSTTNRSPDDVRLIAVTKTFPLTHVEAATAAGLSDLGENRVQEALQKQAATPGHGICWHLIGHLQSNKARKAVVFDWIHSVDSVDLLHRLDQAADEQGRTPQLLIQVDLAGEATKHGATVAEVPSILKAAASCRAVVVRGLMVLPPLSQDRETARPYFRRLRQLRDELRPQVGDTVSLDELSMGMSHDFEVAIQEGATMVRLGTALFGPRPHPPSMENDQASTKA